MSSAQETLIDIAWLPDSQHLVAFSPSPFPELMVHLYEVGVDDPIASLDLNEALPHEDLASLYEPNHANSQTLDVSDDGQWVLVNFGLAMLVIPIEYE